MKTNKRKYTWVLLVIPLMTVLASMTQCTKEDSGNTATEENVPVSEVAENPEKVYDEVDEQPEFIGGQEAMFKYIIDEVKYPEQMIQEEVEGTVYVQFTVTSSGAIRDAQVLRGVHEMLDQEALRVIKGMPDWDPGIKDGKEVAVKFTIPISFKLK